jgi:fucose permease
MGITAPATNMLVAQASPEKSAAALNLLNFSWTAGAVVGTPAVSIILPRTGAWNVTYAIAGALGVAAVAVMLGKFGSGRVQATDVVHEGGRVGMPLIVMLTIPVLFLYVGVENGIAGWLPLFCTRIFGEHAWLIASAQGTFWGALLAGRLFAPVVLRKVSPQGLISYALAIALLGGVLVLGSVSPLTLLPGVALSGLGLAVVLPTAVSQVTRFDPRAADRFAGVMFAFAGLGGAAIPSSIGLISTKSGSLRMGLTLAVAAVVLMLLLNLRISRIFRSERARASSAAV